MWKWLTYLYVKVVRRDDYSRQVHKNSNQLALNSLYVWIHFYCQPTHLFSRSSRLSSLSNLKAFLTFVASINVPCVHHALPLKQHRPQYTRKHTNTTLFTTRLPSLWNRCCPSTSPPHSVSLSSSSRRFLWFLLWLLEIEESNYRVRYQPSYYQLNELVKNTIRWRADWIKEPREEKKTTSILDGEQNHACGSTKSSCWCCCCATSTLRTLSPSLPSRHTHPHTAKHPFTHTQLPHNMCIQHTRGCTHIRMWILIWLRVVFSLVFLL